MFEKTTNNICADGKSPPIMSSHSKRSALIVIASVALLSALIGASVVAVSVQRLTVPDLVVVDQLNQAAIQLRPPSPSAAEGHSTRAQSIFPSSSSSSNISQQQQQQPEAASLINSQDLNGSTISGAGSHEQQQLTFECLISYDRKKDKNLIIKWHHDDRVEPIYQWIVELDKISIAPQYKPYIVANNSSSQQQHRLLSQLDWPRGANSSSANSSSQLLEASFRLIRPSKELGGKYTCSAISVQNDDSKWRKMIVFTPPRSFKFNATRADFAREQQQSPRARQLIGTNQLPLQLDSQLQHQSGVAPSSASELPLAYRSRGFDGQPASTISPQMYKTIDYVNVNPNYRPPTMSTRLSSDGLNANTGSNMWQQQRRLMATNGASTQLSREGRYSGVKLVCDIDQIFPVPEVSIYRLATTSTSTNGSHPPMDKLTKSETKIEKNPLNGLYHIQVVSVLLDDEIESLRTYGPNEPVLFECLIGLTNLELSKYSDNKRSLVYRRRPSTGSQQQGMQAGDQDAADDNGELRSASSSSAAAAASLPGVYALLMMNSLLLMLARKQVVFLTNAHV